MFPEDERYFYRRYIPVIGILPAIAAMRNPILEEEPLYLFPVEVGIYFGLLFAFVKIGSITLEGLAKERDVILTKNQATAMAAYILTPEMMVSPVSRLLYNSEFEIRLLLLIYIFWTLSSVFNPKDKKDRIKGVIGGCLLYFFFLIGTIFVRAFIFAFFTVAIGDSATSP